MVFELSMAPTSGLDRWSTCLESSFNKVGAVNTGLLCLAGLVLARKVRLGIIFHPSYIESNQIHVQFGNGKNIFLYVSVIVNRSNIKCLLELLRQHVDLPCLLNRMRALDGHVHMIFYLVSCHLQLLP